MNDLGAKNFFKKYSSLILYRKTQKHQNLCVNKKLLL